MRFERPGFSMHFELVDGLLPRDTVFLHGNLSANLWWEPAMREWQGQGGGKGRAILVEWRGCGGSRDFEGGLDLLTLAADLNALIEDLSLAKVNIVGHSTGGLIALYAMAARPELFASALLLDPVSPEGLELPPALAQAFTRMSEDREFCASVLLSTIHGTKLATDFRERLVEAAFSVAPAVWLGVPAMLAAPPPLALSAIYQPVLVAHGEHDQVLPAEKSRALAEKLPNGKFLEIRGRGHCTNVEDPLLFTEIANHFFRPTPPLVPKRNQYQLSH